MHDPAERDAIIAKTELMSQYPDFRALTEILCSRTPAEILRIRDFKMTATVEDTTMDVLRRPLMLNNDYILMARLLVPHGK